MSPVPPDATYAVLGLIDKVPGSSGHELAAVADRSFAHFWPISRTLLYRELTRVVKAGWATADRVEQTQVPSKWVYRITAEGQRALAGWLELPVSAVGSYRSGVMLRFFFSHLMSRDQVQELLEAYRGELQNQRDEFAAIVEKLASVPSPGARFGRLSALHGLRTAEARIAWVAEAAAELDEETQP